ncbi:MAG TPA: NYN domain-containing protein [Ilumatobacteraceae bacterium]|nr:NYN domain-containing protein [Ilumatobacteraceae bacterium]
MSDPASIEHRHLRSAIEYAVVMADEITKRRAAIPVPRELRGLSSKTRIPTGSLGRLRRAIDADESFRTAIAAGALPELVDPIGILWLQRPEGWAADVERLVAEMADEAADADQRTALRREEKRRRAAEQVAVRLRTDVTQRDASISELRTVLDGLRADVVKAEDEVATLRAELADVRIEARHARDREAAAQAKLDAALNAPVDAGEARPVDVSDAVAAGERDGVDPAAVSDVARAVRELAGRLEALLPTETPDAGPRSAARQPLRLPGGVIASSAEAAEFLLRSDAVVLVDGYNVAKLAWPSRSLEAQRNQLLDAVENLARRFGSDLTVVFDGAAVVGAHAARRRLVRVVFSPEGVIADDVIRDEVRRLPSARAVVVVTNDAEIVADVKALGANVVPSNAHLAVLSSKR